ncbi:chemotaxis response regulator protein-glutamate methylesterase [Halorientalis brevis]|uniref:Protein-glutamate methylesterase/protein-glutamine glutaminase n=2 Tax=Halorientalis brevis TaxID=1126241 RepID=A0ABD6CE78_9EURY
MRSVISDILETGGVEVVAQAKNGLEAVEAVDEHDPDVVTMDVEMPEMNGIEAVEQIMSAHPTPVLMLSAHTDENADVTFQALEKGAVDFFTKPGGEVSMEMSRLEDQLVDMVTSVASVDVSVGTKSSTTTPDEAYAQAVETVEKESTAQSQRSSATADASAGTTADPTDATYVENATLLIGSSTGGPTVVEQILSELPAAANLRILIVQHMPDGFTGRFAQRLDNRSAYDVTEAADGDRIGGGEALVACGGKHMVVSNYASGRLRVKLTETEPVNSVRPAVDVTMESAAETIDGPMTAVILTGMGNDGADGIRALKQAGAKTLAQDEATSAVYGMPKRAVETGMVDTVLPLDEIADGIVDTITKEN